MNFEKNLNDRKLGHEWYGWDGNVEAHEAFIREPKKLFIGLFFFSFAVLLGAGFLLAWGIQPRLESLHPLASKTVLGLLAAATAALLFVTGILCVALLSRRAWRISERIVHQLFRVFPIVEFVARQFGVSKDRLGYSLIEIHNEISRSRLRKVSSGRILCLAPRCLDRENVEQIRALATEYDCDFYMAPTGAQARQRIINDKPTAIIGIACERDLVTGIRDVGYRLPVIGIANKRPAGPCKAAFIDPNELREAIESFRAQLDLPSPRQLATESGRS